MVMILRWENGGGLLASARLFMYRTLFLRLLGALSLAVFATGCALTTPSGPKIPPKPKPKPLAPLPATKKSYWNAEAARGEPAISINLTEQRARFFRDGKEVGQSPVSSGKRGFETPTGSFTVVQLDRNHLSNLYGSYVNSSGGLVQGNVDVKKDPRPAGTSFRGAKMPYFIRFNGGIGLHAGRLPGYPASHGCVRMPHTMATHFFANAPLGTPVTVTGTARTRPEPSRPARRAVPKSPKSEPTGPTEPTSPDTTTSAPPTPETPPKVEPAPEKAPEPKPAPPAPAPAPAGA
jgi:lipoprotein-anchoring transpeptidase ErfK/SrfK